MNERLTPEREAEYRSLVERTTPLGAATAAPGALAVVLTELAAVRAELDEARGELAKATEYGVRIPGSVWPEDGVLLDGDTFDRADQEARLERCRDSWPNAELVQRNVHRAPWTEVAR
ncbi:hypothetical protein ACFZAO_05735 [Streptomyces griseoaurantiacus]|uniref:hypothetical protein n=1 Tax=Streptomyces griseoaurantiacus TaxID=68213 RepID=UPI0036E55EB0